MMAGIRAPLQSPAAGRTPGRGATPRGDAALDRRLEGEAQRFAHDPARPTRATMRQGQAAMAAVPGLGQPLPLAVQAALQPRLGVDLSTLRVHHDEAAAQAAQAQGAKAYTKGRDVVFGRGQWQPGQPAGQALLAHEVAHAAQQAQPGAAAGVQRDPLEGQGPGLSPPSEDFVPMPAGESGVEDGHLLFARDVVTLDAADREALDALVAGAGPGASVHVHGYASTEGDADYNLNLSAHRAVAVKQYLLSQLPEGTRVTAYAYGETTAFGQRALNRRVGVDVIEPGGLLDPGGGARLRISLLPPGALTLGAPGVPSVPSTPTLPSGMLATDLRGLLGGPGGGRPPWADPPPLWLNPTLPARPRFDLGAVAPDFALRGVPYTDRDARSFEQHFDFWYGNFVSLGLDAATAAWLAQKGTEMAAGTDLSLQAPTQQELLDRRMDTEPTIVPIFNDAILRWLLDRR
jgi:outer membrane protein OmpA-like peptidoglycan-associated protein